MIICLMILSQIKRKMLNFTCICMKYFIFSNKKHHFIFKRNVYILRYILIQTFKSHLHMCTYSGKSTEWCIHNEKTIPRDCHWRIQRGRGYMVLTPPPPALNFMTPRARELTLMVNNVYQR